METAAILAIGCLWDLGCTGGGIGGAPGCSGGVPEGFGSGYGIRWRRELEGSTASPRG